MEPGWAGRPRGESRGRSEGPATTARPLVRPAPRSAMFFPLVVLVAVLPGLYALTSWDLTPPGPWWGLRGLAVLDGHTFDQTPAAAELTPVMEAQAFRAVAMQPPLYAWLEALGLALSTDRDPRATVLPSYIAGALGVLLVYWHGRLWRGPGVGLIAALLTGFNRNLLLQMQQATPTTLGLAGVLTALLCYGRHARTAAESSRPGWSWGGTFFWTVLGGLALGLSLMAVGGFGLLAVPVVLLHQAYLRAGTPPAERSTSWWRAWRSNPSLTAGGAVLLIALAVAVPWHVLMFSTYRFDFLNALLHPFERAGPELNLLARLIALAPATLVLGLFACARTIRLALIDESDDREIVGGVFWVVWISVAALAPALWPSGPRPALNLFLLVPLNLLAAQTIVDLAVRRVPIRVLSWLAPAAAVAVFWTLSQTLQRAVTDLAHGRADSATALGLHLALDLLVVVVWCTRRLDRWARRRDDRQRRVLGGFLAAVFVFTVTVGILEVCFRHKETDDLLLLRAMVLRRNREQPLALVAVVSPEIGRPGLAGPPPGGRLRFILRTALPRLPQRDLTTINDLLTLPDVPRLVILAGTDQRPSYAFQSRLGLEAIHPGRPGALEAFATAHDSSRPGARPRSRH